ncbi:MAG: hypothetical protein KC457_00930 [Myxococcales bacterium]|nr:hypothetical protein [Myxococcales bacterium]
MSFDRRIAVALIEAKDHDGQTSITVGVRMAVFTTPGSDVDAMISQLGHQGGIMELAEPLPPPSGHAMQVLRSTVDAIPVDWSRTAEWLFWAPVERDGPRSGPGEVVWWFNPAQA